MIIRICWGFVASFTPERFFPGIRWQPLVGQRLLVTVLAALVLSIAKSPRRNGFARLINTAEIDEGCWQTAIGKATR